jgi:hypothetical protein
VTTLVASPAGRPSPPVTLALHHLAEPATGLHVGERERKDHGRTDPALGCDTGVRGAAENLDLPAIRADGADRDIGGRAAVVVEGHGRRAEVGGPDVSRPPKPALLAHAEQKRDRRMIELLFRKLGRQRDENATAGAVVAAERGLRLIDDLAPR